MDMVKECQVLDKANQSEKEEVSMILRRQRVAKLLQIEISLRQLLDLDVTDDYIQEQQGLITSFSKLFLIIIIISLFIFFKLIILII